MNPIPMKYKKEFEMLYRVLTQKKYEFWNKSSFVYTCKSGIIVGAMAVDGNMYDGHMLCSVNQEMAEPAKKRAERTSININCFSSVGQTI